MIENKTEITLNDEETEMLNNFDTQIMELQRKKTEYINELKCKRDINEKKLCILTYENSGKEVCRLAYIKWKHLYNNSFFLASFFSVDSNGCMGNQIHMYGCKNISYQKLDGYNIDEARNLLKKVKKGNV